MEKPVWQSSALVNPTTTLNRDTVPIGDDIEPVGESRVDVETGNEEEVEEGIPSFEVLQKNPKCCLCQRSLYKETSSS